MDLSISIRTMVIEKGKVSFDVGGGIVYDSDSAAEYAEVMFKAQPLFGARGAPLPRPERPAASPTPTTIHQHGLTHLP
jgi:para-aminobenzoate synthetase component 1